MCTLFCKNAYDELVSVHVYKARMLGGFRRSRRSYVSVFLSSISSLSCRHHMGKQMMLPVSTPALPSTLHAQKSLAALHLCTQETKSALPSSLHKKCYFSAPFVTIYKARTEKVISSKSWALSRYREGEIFKTSKKR